MTELRAEGRHGRKTAPTQKRDTLPMEDGDQLSSYSAKPSAKKKLKRSESPEKFRKHVTWVPEIKIQVGERPGCHKISAGPELDHVKQQMNLTYNGKETQTG